MKGTEHDGVVPCESIKDAEHVGADDGDAEHGAPARARDEARDEAENMKGTEHAVSAKLPDEMPDDAGKWNLRHASRQFDEAVPCRVLRDNLHLLPNSGPALDLACGRGGNAIALARAGLQVSAWDCSEVALQVLRDRAHQARLNIHVLCCDVTRHTPEPEQFDVIVVSRFLDRRIMPSLLAGLRSGGLIFYQTFTRQRPGHGPRRKAYRLQEAELLQHFSECRLLFYREDDALVTHEASDEAMLVARRR